MRYISISRYTEGLLTKIHQHNQLIKIRVAGKQRGQSTKDITWSEKYNAKKDLPKYERPERPKKGAKIGALGTWK